jgi:hypothetical protein
MWLKDYNGDGDKNEFALFDAQACMGLPTTLIGYSKREDKLLQYPIHLETLEEGKRSTRVQLWADYLFSKEPQSPGVWRYEVDYSGRGGFLYQHEVRYNKEKELFEAKVVAVEGSNP